MKVRPVLGFVLCALLTVGVGCASSPSEDTSGSDSALRALQSTDKDLALVEKTAATAPPEKFASVKSWRLDYVEMPDSNPDNNFKGVLLFGLDENDKTVLYVPSGYTGKDAIAAAVPGAPSLALFSGDVDENGSLVPVTFKLGDDNDDATVASEKASLQWVMDERTRLLTELKAQGNASSSPGSVGTQAWFSWFGNETTKDATFCALHVGAFIATMFLGANPLVYLAVDGAISLAEGAVDVNAGRKEGMKGMVTGGAMTALGGAGYAAAKGIEASSSSALKTGAKIVGKGGTALVVGVLAYDGYENIKKDGLVGGVADTAMDIVPDSCKKAAPGVLSYLGSWFK